MRKFFAFFLLGTAMMALQTGAAPPALTGQGAASEAMTPEPARYESDAHKQEKHKQDPRPPAEPAGNSLCSVDRPLLPPQGEITIGCPKVWRSDRVFTVLDGLLRDVDSITVKALQDLDPNQANAAEVISILNELQVSAKLDQGQALTNKLNLQKIQAVRGSELNTFKSIQQSNQLLLKRRQELERQKLDLQKREVEMITQGKADPTLSPQTNKDFLALTNGEKAIQDQINEIDSQTSKTPAITDATGITSTGVDVPKTGTATFALPDDLKKSLQGLLGNPTFPPSMRMDNVIELLHERLAREFSIMYDDLSRQSEMYDLYLVQFDIGLLPKHGAKDRAARVELRFTEKGVLAYELYPGTSSYNIMRGLDKTTRFGLSGAAQTLFGFGLAAAFNHEKNQLRSGLSQTLYVSGFGEGSNDFGWQIGAAPFDNFVTPGQRIVDALILVPKGPDGKTARSEVTLNVTGCWPEREKRYHWPLIAPADSGCKPPSDDSEPRIRIHLPDEQKIQVAAVSYRPLALKETPGSSGSSEQPDTNTVLITFKDPIDPNLTITAGSKIINRVRDVRGRAIYNATAETLAGTPNEQAALTASRFGFLEKDAIDPDTWLQLNSRSAVLNLSRANADTNAFPVITLANPGGSGGELLKLLAGDATLRVDEWEFYGKEPPESAFLPLFTLGYAAGPTKSYVEELDASRVYPARIRINSKTYREGRARPVWLHEAAQVVLEAKDGAPKDCPNKQANCPKEPQWPLKCDEVEGSLSCIVPYTRISDKYQSFPTKFKVWVDEPPYYGRPGLWSDSDLEGTGSPKQWHEQAYAATDWSDIREVACPDCAGKPDHWQASIRLENADKLTPSQAPSAPASSQKAGETTSEQRSNAQNAHGQGRNAQNAHGRAIAKDDDCEKPLEPEAGLCLQEAPDIHRQLCGLSRKFKTAKDVPVHWQGLVPDEVSKQQATNQNTDAINDLKKPEKQQIKATFSEGNRLLTLEVPFAALPAMTVPLHVRNHCYPGTGAADNAELSLPALAGKLEPGPVKLTDLKNGTYRLEGERLRAVDKVRLEGNGKVIITDAITGFNNVDFSPLFNNKPLDPGNYSVFVQIKTMTVPIQQEADDHKLHQLLITVPDPKADKQKPAATEAAGNGKTNLDLSVNFDVKAKGEKDSAAVASARKAAGGKEAKKE